MYLQLDAESTRITNISRLSMEFSGFPEISGLHEADTNNASDDASAPALQNATYFTTNHHDVDDMDVDEMGPYGVPSPVDESSIADVTPHPEDHNFSEVIYDTGKGAIKRGKNKQIHCHVFSYNQRKNSATMWTGSIQ